MLRITQAAFDQMAASRRVEREVSYIASMLRERGDPLAQRLDEATLRREIVVTLQVCTRLGLTSDVDRLSFCMLEITTFAGLRELPKLGGLFNYADGPSDARMSALLQAMPPQVWRSVSESAGAVRIQRGWE